MQQHVLADDNPEHVEISRTCPDSGTYLKFRGFATFMIPVLASFPRLPSFVQEESNIRNIQIGKYMCKVLSEEPDELCTSMLKKIPRWALE